MNVVAVNVVAVNVVAVMWLHAVILFCSVVCLKASTDDKAVWCFNKDDGSRVFQIHAHTSAITGNVTQDKT